MMKDENNEYIGGEQNKIDIKHRTGILEITCDIQLDLRNWRN